jgi:hypothetical protein
MTIIYSKWVYTVQNGHIIFQIGLKYVNIFPSMALQNLPKLGFSVCKYNIWQPWRLVALLRHTRFRSHDLIAARPVK